MEESSEDLGPQSKPIPSAELGFNEFSNRRIDRVGRLQVPLAGPYRPWATLWRLPDGRLVWCLRLWNVDHAEHRCVSTHILHAFARINDLPALSAEIDALVARALDRARREELERR